MNAFDGIYIAYVTGAQGFSAILFVLRSGRITGADVGGVRYAGSYEAASDHIQGTLQVAYPPGIGTITGHSTGSDGLTLTMPFQLKLEEIGQGMIQLQTPVGPVTATVSRLNDLP